MSNDTRRILDMLAAGTISAAEAEELLSALGAANAPKAPTPTPASPPGRFLRISVERPATDGARERKVNIRVPVTVMKSGLRLGALLRGFKDDRNGLGQRISERLRARGLDIDFDHLDPADLDAILQDVGEMTVDVDDGRARIRLSRE
jgi:SHOCT-like domain